MVLEIWVSTVLFLLPIYVANASAMVFGGGTPLDLDSKWTDQRPILGKGKTFKGTFFGIFFGTMTGLLLWAMFPDQTAQMYPNFVLLGFVLSVGAVLGDLIKSFLKRRMGKQSGEEWFLGDQLDFMIGAIIVGWVFFAPSPVQIVAMLVISVIVHKIANVIAFKARLKSVPW
ncbi:MAG: CDP-2,3-bis-(O-geranylgeranyl)-sn-glycerol synthase [Candidatus Diapherotrites archaeon]|uniref:CDP-archaeol synthase n=1 Tax=Candidatus Iainarchaeum sp. TaxID=3101447 RepID=A0A8T4L9C1_9ARCH|nr:CDP-2,3-bis-(O-geranylgeranyl)-sn-glycerol synthase [Candidatus Diapherotrites archaeon]